MSENKLNTWMDHTCKASNFSSFHSLGVLLASMWHIKMKINLSHMTFPISIHGYVRVDTRVRVMVVRIRMIHTTLPKPVHSSSFFSSDIVTSMVTHSNPGWFLPSMTLQKRVRVRVKFMVSVRCIFVMTSTRRHSKWFGRNRPRSWNSSSMSLFFSMHRTINMYLEYTKV